MKNYERLEIAKMSDINYLRQLFHKQRIIIQVLVNEKKGEIDELISYGLDKEAKSYYKYLVRDNDELKENVIIEVLYPFYNYKQEKRDFGCAPIDIQDDNQNVLGMWSVLCELSRTHEDFQDGMHFEYYIPKGKGDIANFGGPMELEFIREWHTSKGEEIPEI